MARNLKVACENAFWNLGRESVVKYGPLLGMRVVKGDTLYDVLLNGIMTYLDLSKKAALPVKHSK